MGRGMLDSYINVTKGFVKGITDWIEIKGFNKDHDFEVIEVFAGTGKLGRRLELPYDNVTDNHKWRYDPELRDNEEWTSLAKHVVEAEAHEAIIASKNTLKLVIMGMPTDKDESAYKAIKTILCLCPRVCPVFCVNPLVTKINVGTAQSDQGRRRRAGGAFGPSSVRAPSTCGSHPLLPGRAS